MKHYVKEFFHRGLMFGGFGPIVAGIVYAILEYTVPDFSLDGTQMLLAIVSTYMIAFVQAGASVFNQIEAWPLPKSLLCHFLSLYAVYVLGYLVNTWIPFQAEVVLIFTGIFVAVYFAIWVSVYLIVKATSRQLNGKLK